MVAPPEGGGATWRTGSMGCGKSETFWSGWVAASGTGRRPLEPKQYASHDYRNELRRNGIVCSMSRKGNCWDNAVVESFFCHSQKGPYPSQTLANGQSEVDPILWTKMGYH